MTSTLGSAIQYNTMAETALENRRKTDKSKVESSSDGCNALTLETFHKLNYLLVVSDLR